jgi:hypothetical protein
VRRPSHGRFGLRSCSEASRPLPAYDWCVLTEGADALELADESDELDEPLEDDEPPSDVPEPVESEVPPPEDVLPDEREDDGYELEDEPPTLLRALALALPELDALRAGSWPLASVAKMTLQVAMNNATVRATALLRMRRTRARLAARRGFTVAADMGDTLERHPKPSLSAL